MPGPHSNQPAYMELPHPKQRLSLVKPHFFSLRKTGRGVGCLLPSPVVGWWG